MLNRILFAVLVFCAPVLALAQGLVSHHDDSLRAEAIDREALSPDFVHAYLLTITEGKPVYSVFGHTAVRLVCPSKLLDYCFTFEVDMHESSWLDFITRRSKAGFAAAPTQMFLSGYADEGRGVAQYELNLTPKQKQTLWKVMDREVNEGAQWTFDFTSVNCSSLALYAIEEALMGDSLHFQKLNPVMNGTLYDLFDQELHDSPWMNLFCHTITIDIGDDKGDPMGKLTSHLLDEALPYATLTDSLGHVRPFIKGRPVTLIKAKWISKPVWLTPTKALLLLLIVVATVWVMRCKRHV